MSKNSGPDTKQIQYDRQLRLWGDHGQTALESGRVCLVGANGLGAEILKALVLPGLGSFTIIDDKVVTLADCGSNFFVHPSMIDQSRARVTCELLKQLNPDVHGTYIDKPAIDILLQQNILDFSQFSVVITANLSFPILKTLANHLWTLKVPLLVARTFGFIGTIRLQIAEHFVIEAHPDDAIPDLRLDRPLKAFENYCKSIDMNSLSREDHLHLPSMVILYKTLQLWQEKTNRTDLPTNRKEKDQFRELLEQLSNHSTYDLNDKYRIIENFEEAKRTIPSRLVRTTIPSAVQDLFNDPSCLQLSDRSHIFWFVINAIKLFTQNEGQGLLPVRGEVPDMITNTSSYVNILRIYQEQAKTDCEIVYNYLVQLLREHNCFSTAISNGQANLQDLVHTYCKNAYFLRMLRSSALQNEDDFLSKYIEQNPLEFSSSNESESDLCWYVGLRLCDLFHNKFNRYPGEVPLSNSDTIAADRQQLEKDLVELKQIGREAYSTSSANQEMTSDPVRESILAELCRYGASELHSIMAFVGGSCAQEAIKLITHQYVPINNLIIYNGIRQTIGAFQL